RRGGTGDELPPPVLRTPCSKGGERKRRILPRPLAGEDWGRGKSCGISAMIGRLRGTLIAKRPPWVLIEVGGVGYELEVPMSTLYDLPDAGREVILLTHYAHKEDTVALYGFLRDDERTLFRDRVGNVVASMPAGATPVARDPRSEAEAALQQLGYKQAEAARLAAAAAADGDDAETIIRKALRAALGR